VAFQHADVVILCFSLVNPHTLRDAQNSWITVIRRYCLDIPIILVGTKLDLRNRIIADKNIITPEEGNAVAVEIEAFAYIECSALTREKLHEVFNKTVCSIIDRVNDRYKLNAPNIHTPRALEALDNEDEDTDDTDDTDNDDNNKLSADDTLGADEIL